MNRYQFIWGVCGKLHVIRHKGVRRTHVRKGFVVIERRAIK